jgi:hypothetical protein
MAFSSTMLIQLMATTAVALMEAVMMANAMVAVVVMATVMASARQQRQRWQQQRRWGEIQQSTKKEMTERAMAIGMAMVTDSDDSNIDADTNGAWCYVYPTTKVNNKVIVHTYLPAQIPLADFKWRMAIFIVILANHSYGFNHHLVHFFPLISAPSIGKTVLKNSPALEPFKQSLLMTANSCQDFFVFLSVFISPHNYPAWFTGISIISNNSFTLFNLKIKGISIPLFFWNFLFASTKN